MASWRAAPAAAQAPESDEVEAALHVGYAVRALADDGLRHGATLAVSVDAPPAFAGWSGRLGADLLAFAPAAEAPTARLLPLFTPALTWRLAEGPQTVKLAVGPALGLQLDGGAASPAYGVKAAVQTQFRVVDGISVVAAVSAVGIVADSVIGAASLGLVVEPAALWSRAQRGEDTTDIAVEVAPELAPVLHGPQAPQPVE